VSTQAFPAAHFAVFPEALIRPCILAGTSARGACPQCGAPWRRVSGRDAEPPYVEPSEPDYYGNGKNGIHRKTGGQYQKWLDAHPKQTVAWEPTCTCGHAETVPCVTLDPFCGAGTTLLVAKNLNRHAVGIELNPDYCRLIVDRLAQDVFALSEVTT
jgi:hypothetical protein